MASLRDLAAVALTRLREAAGGGAFDLALLEHKANYRG
jgi:hypothetical protein